MRSSRPSRRSASSSRWGPWPVKPRSRSPSRRSRSSASELARRRGARAGPVLERAPRRCSPSCAARSANGSASSATARGAIGAQRERVAGELQVPGARCASREARPARMRREQRVALGERRAVGAARRPRAAARAPRRAGRGARGAAPGGPLISSRRSGVKTLSSGRSATSSRRSTGAPSARHALDGCRRGCVADAQLVLARRRRCSSTTTRAAPAPKRTSSRSLRVRGERPVQPK